MTFTLHTEESFPAIYHSHTHTHTKEKKRKEKKRKEKKRKEKKWKKTHWVKPATSKSVAAACDTIKTMFPEVH